MLYTARRVGGTEAMAAGLCDRLAPPERLRDEALELAQEIAASATLAVRSIRATLRRGLVENVRQALAHERTEQMALATTEDCREGIRASIQRRTPMFHGL
jgi:enoyl-CoA hydratase/carnithine racemase